jgi:hypothetical protein
LENSYSPLIDSIEHRDLAAGDDKIGRFAINRKCDERLLKRPVEILDIAVHVLVIPGQLAGVGIQRQGRVRKRGQVTTMRKSS